MLFAIVRLLLSLLLRSPAAAAPSGADFLLLEPTARAVAQGGAYCAQRGRPEGLRYNPASLSGLKGLKASLAHVSAAGDWSHDWAGVGLRLGPVGIGAEILASSVSPFTLYDSSGTAFDSAGAGSQNLMLALAVPVGSWLSLGAGLRYFRSQLYKYESQGVSADLGLHAGRKDWPIEAGLALQNLGMQSAYIQDADPLPLAIRGGLLAHLNLDRGLELKPALDVLAFTDPTRPLELRCGAEADIFDRVGLRAGYLMAGPLRQLSFGAGLNWDGWGLDYAYLPSGELGSSQMVELHISTGR